jgi:hypothetical protein
MTVQVSDKKNIKVMPCVYLTNLIYTLFTGYSAPCVPLRLYIPLEACGIACPQLLFTCSLRPAGGRLQKREMDPGPSGPDDI